MVRSQNNQILQQIFGLLNQHNLQTDLLIIGADATGSHIYHVTHPGQVQSYDAVGYAAIGSGGTHATISLSLGDKNKDKSLPEALFSVYEAKVAAQIAQGVGAATDIVIIDINKEVRIINPTDYPVLLEVHKERPTLNASEIQKLSDIFKDL